MLRPRVVAMAPRAGKGRHLSCGCGAGWGAQKRLTNIALVKYKKHGHKFELACYRNTVMAWRNKA
jgi:hypothetical protein